MKDGKRKKERKKKIAHTKELSILFSFVANQKNE